MSNYHQIQDNIGDFELVFVCKCEVHKLERSVDVLSPSVHDEEVDSFDCIPAINIQEGVCLSQFQAEIT